MEDEAALIKNKYQKKSSQVGTSSTTITKNDLFTFNFSQPQQSLQPKKEASQNKMLNPKDLSIQEKKLLAGISGKKKSNADGTLDDKEEDMMIALQLLNQYKKDPNFIQKELQNQKKIT